VTFNGQTVAPTGYFHSSITFTSLALGGSASSITVSVTINGQRSNPLTYPIAAPAISGVNPSVGPTSGETLVTISGTKWRALVVCCYSCSLNLSLFGFSSVCRHKFRQHSARFVFQQAGCELADFVF
jgi:hypothetical protein